MGINEYANFISLKRAESDARAIGDRLNFDGDESPVLNFHVQMLLSSRAPVTRAKLRAALRNLFASSTGLDLAFYFAGHGFVSETGGHLVTADGVVDDYGITMDELHSMAHRSQASSVLLLLDCCHAGAAGDMSTPGGDSQSALLRENMTIMAASLPMQAAVESAEGGLFSAALRDALDGAAADLLGEVSVASVYSVIERRFSLWQQQPVAKSYVSRPIVLRRVKARLSRQELRRLVDLFPTPDHKYPMDPNYDPVRDVDEVALTPEVPYKLEIGRLFKRYRDLDLLKASNPGEDLYYVAQRSHTVELTLFGKEYWRLAKRGVA